MSEGMFSRHAALNAVGAIPASAEELSQRYLKLFQQYSRLKAQHAVLKKAVIKEQASNISLQGNVKEKEKELRKLQEQLDLLAFHNEKLTKRIQAVQDSDQKGNHFSLLGGSVKKELEKSAQALDEANLDLERKIQENERLHEELTERQFEFTDSINSLLKQIQDLEKRVQELGDENANLSSESKTTVIKEVVDEKEQNKLLKEIESLKAELQEKTDLMDEQDEQIQENDQKLLSEIHSLRSILLAKLGGVKETSLYDHVPVASEALQQLEKQAKQYFSGDKVKIKELPHEVAERLALTSQTYSQELSSLVTELEETKKSLNELLLEKEEAEKNNKSSSDLQKRYDELNNQHKEYIKTNQEKSKQLEDELESHKNKLNSHQDRAQQLETDSKQLEAKIEEKTTEITKLLATIEVKQKDGLTKIHELQLVNTKLEKENKDLQKKIEEQKLELENVITNSAQEEKRSTLDKETQVDGAKEAVTNEEDEEVFIYPKTEEPQEKEEEEDEEVFVYRGMDAVVDTPSPEPLKDTTPTDTDKSKITEKDVQAREEKLKVYYEQQLDSLTQKIQLTDSKAVRFASMYKSMKERLIKEDKEKQMMLAEIEKLNRDVKNVQDLLATTESNYQKQVDTMTEFISSLQQNAEDQQRQQHRQQQHSGRRPQTNNYNHNSR
ncbi:unnamed protein product [Mucor hiemalis]